MEIECWGCNYDYLENGYSSEDLIAVRIYGIDEYVCPDCIDDIPEDAGADV